MDIHCSLASYVISGRYCVTSVQVHTCIYVCVCVCVRVHVRVCVCCEGLHVNAEILFYQQLIFHCYIQVQYRTSPRTDCQWLCQTIGWPKFLTEALRQTTGLGAGGFSTTTTTMMCLYPVMISTVCINSSPLEILPAYAKDQS